MNLVCLCVCVSTYFSASKSPSFMTFRLKASFGPGWNMTKSDFYVSFLRIFVALFVF